jgi:hypothetical protein
MMTISATYQALAHLATQNPTWREHYLEAPGNNPSNWLIELQLELP